MCNIIKNQKPIKSNLSTDEWKALTSLGNSKSIYITQADMGNITVILNNADYKLEVRQPLDDGPYEKIEEKKVKTLLNENNAQISKLLSR